ncbi:unnamed protein product [Didymodactylos carnosus]|uniref:CRAL-TRIO domain-containing protein n=1 Tax=Didymodactylos carnosus TaxID=1234261 RepID=A0A8S2KE53_9BILA|nr:unnamed protein product [Didymodactylos carnosus]CAF3850090.1 unnamed protein product [Didymodactylos carnosus]
MSSLPFGITQLTLEQQKQFHLVHDQLKPDYTSYIQYKIQLQKDYKTNFHEEEYLKDEEEEWKYEIHRHLRARKWNVADTITSIRNTVQWRIDNRADSMLLESEPTDKLAKAQRAVPFSNHGYAKDNSPLYIEKTGKINVDIILTDFTLEEIIYGHIFIQEFNCQRARDRSKLVSKYVETISTIMDFKGMDLSARKVIHLIKHFLHIDNNYYPERMGKMFVLNTPRIFPIMYNLVRPWLDLVTSSKISILKNEGYETTLLEHIDADQLPSEYGGTCTTCATSPDCIPVYD